MLELANVDGASTVIIAIPNAFEAGQAIEQCRKINPKLLIVARAHSDEEEAHLKHLGADDVIMGEREIGLGMVDVVSRDSRAVAEITAADAVASALAPLAAAGAAGKVDATRLEAAVEAAQAIVQHADTGPAEPPAMVAAFGEEPELVAPIEAPVEPPHPQVQPFVPETPKPVEPARVAGVPFHRPRCRRRQTRYSTRKCHRRSERDGTVTLAVAIWRGFGL